MLRRLCAALLLAGSAPASAAWHEASTTHFVIYADQKPSELREFATKLERFDKALRVRFGLDDPPLGPNNRLTVYVVRDTLAVQRLMGGKSREVAGFYLPRASGSVAFVPQRADAGYFALTEDAIFFHEYTHHFMLGNFAGAFPAWFVEGFAEFHSTARFDSDGKITLGYTPVHRAPGLILGEPLPLPRMLGGDIGKLNSEQRESLYGRGWALTHMLYLEPSRRGQLGKYIAAINGGTAPLAAAQGAFGDLRTLERELNAYLKRRQLSGLVITPDKLTIGPIAARPLSRGEAAFMPVRLRSTRGVNEQAAQALVAEGRRVAAPYPNDPMVQGMLAEVEHDAGHWQQAEAAADRALAADPKSVQAMI